MKIQSKSTSLTLAALLTTLAWGTGAHATSLRVAAPAQPAGESQFQPVAFQDGTEAQLLRRAYHILATGDHDYKGHRVHAMHAVEAAGKLLGMDLRGDDKDKTPQPLSDEKLREAQGLINQVMGSAAVKDQKRVVKHLDEAGRQIDLALKIR